MNGYWAPHREARDFYGVSDSTIRRWASTNKIVFKRTPSGQRTYFINDKTCSENKLSLENTILENYVYCRVSSNKQKAFPNSGPLNCPVIGASLFNGIHIC